MKNSPKPLKQEEYTMEIVNDLWVTRGYVPKTKRTALFKCTTCLSVVEIRTDRKNQYECLSCANSRRATTHGGRKDVLYNRYDGQKTRCSNPLHRDYHNYGARGITFYEEWFNNYSLYKAYVMSLPNAMEEGRSVDRVNNNYGYMPMNLRWATHTQQANNKRNTSESNRM